MSGEIDTEIKKWVGDLSNLTFKRGFLSGVTNVINALESYPHLSVQYHIKLLKRSVEEIRNCEGSTGNCKANDTQTMHS